MSHSPHTIAHLFKHAVQTHGDSPVIIRDEDGTRLSFSDASTLVATAAARLAEDGCQKGDRICFYGPIHAETLILFWAAMELGLVFVPVDYRAAEVFFLRVAKEVSPRWILCDGDRYSSALKMGVPVIVLDGETQATVDESSLFSSWLGSGSGNACVMSVVSPEDPAVILFTSGSTGHPKGVVLSQGALYRSAKVTCETFDWRPSDILFNLGELNTMTGLRNPAITVLHAGCAFIETTPATREHILAIGDCIRRREATIVTGNPIFFRQLEKNAARLGSSLSPQCRMGICTGSVLPRSLITAFEHAFGVPLLNNYGLTETGGISIAFSFHGKTNHTDALGFPIDCDVEIIDERGCALPLGQAGEIRIRSDRLMTGYLGQPELTAQVLKDSWLYTGDLGRMAEDGQVTLLGRLREIIKDTNGEIIYPTEVEIALLEHPEVKDAGVCGYAVGEEERLAAFIVPQSMDLQEAELFHELRTWLWKRLGRTRIPKIFQIIDAVPRNLGGKVLQTALRDRLE